MMTPTDPIAHQNVQADVLQHLALTHELMEKKGLPRSLSHLIELRVSQINQCAFCVKMHTTDARADGETNERLDRLIVWRQVSDFTDAEKAAFAWAEALTRIDETTDYGALRAELRAHYEDEMISLITVCVAMINLWNRIQVSAH